MNQFENEFQNWESVFNLLGLPSSNKNLDEFKNAFYNGFLEVPERLEKYVFENKIIPNKDLNELIDTFREYYPLKGRLSELSGFYFDDRISFLKKEYEEKLAHPIKRKILELELEFQKNHNEFLIHKKENKQDVERNSSLELDQEYTQYKPIKTYNEAFEKMKKVFALNSFKIILEKFVEKFGKGNLRIFKEEYKEIEQFIQDTEEIKVREAVDYNHFANISKEQINKYEYIRQSWVISLLLLLLPLFFVRHTLIFSHLFLNLVLLLLFHPVLH